MTLSYWHSPIGSLSAASPMSPWRAPESTGSLSTTCSEGYRPPATLLVARHMKAVPGRKPMSRMLRIADLLRHGLLKASFVPDKTHRELRELVRYRRTPSSGRKWSTVSEGGRCQHQTLTSPDIGRLRQNMLNAPGGRRGPRGARGDGER